MKNGKALTIAGLLVTGLAFHTQFARAQAAGSPDTTFGTGGTVTTTFSGQTVTPIGAVQQSNGDIVVISQFDFQNDAGTGVGVTRYTLSGKLDTTFGTKGSTFSTFPNIIFQALWFAVQPNGAIVIGGGTAPSGTTDGANQGFGLVRFTAGGALDSTFGTNGLVNTQIGPRTANPGAFLLQPNGQIVMTGLEGGNGEKPTNPDSIPNMVVVVRYNTNGSLDTTFGSGGVALLNDASTLPGANQLALLTNGDYLIVSTAFGGPVTAQLSSSGVLQTSVTGGTIVNTTTTSFGELGSATLFQPNGDFIIVQEAGTINRVTTIMGQRFSETAVQDTTFSSTTFTFAGERLVAPNGIALQANGRILVGGSVVRASPISGGLARLNTNGTLDTAFGNEGTLTTDNSVNGVLVQTDGNIVAVEAVGTDGIALARYLAN